MRTTWKNRWERYLSLWRKLTGVKLFLFYLLHYTVLYTVMWHFMYAPFGQAGKTFVWQHDGNWYFDRLVYLSKTLREGIKALISGRGWRFPLYEFQFAPIKQEMQNELIQYLAVFWPWNRIDKLYDLLIPLRIYLAGLAFSVFGFYLAQAPLSVLTAAVSYGFCGFSIFAGVRHPMFIGHMILFPFLVIGAEKIFKKERPYLFIATVCAAVVNMVHIAMMMAVIILIYAEIRIFDLYPRQEKAEEALNAWGRFLLAGAVGVALSGAILVPTLLIYLDTGRVGRDIFLSEGLGQYLHYGLSYYKNFLGDYMMEPGSMGALYLGFSVLIAPALALLFTTQGRGNRMLRRSFLVLTIMICVPIVVYVLSGFNDMYGHRWSFAYAFCQAVILMLMLPRLSELSSPQFARICGICAVYFLLCYFVVSRDGAFSKDAFILLGVALLLLGLLRSFGRGRMMAVCLLITCVSSYYASYRMFDKSQRNYPAEFLDEGAPYGVYDASQYGALGSSLSGRGGEQFYRVDGNAISWNSIGANCYWNLNSFSGFSSFVYPSYSQWLDELEMGKYRRLNINYGTDKTSLMTLLSVKYYAQGSKGQIPYGFTELERVERGGITNVIWENQYALPIGYTYSAYIPQPEYDQLTALEKQEAQMQALALEEAPQSAAISAITPNVSSHKIPFQIIEINGLTWQNGTLTVTGDNATMKLEFDAVPRVETYLRVVNLDLNAGASSRYWNLAVETDKTKTGAFFSADAMIYSAGLKTQLVNLGYSEEGVSSCTLTFPQKGTYKMETLEVWCMPFDHYGEQADALRAEALENVETNWRGLTGSISVSRDKLLCLSIPYDRGWSAYVDGKKVNLMQANTAFMAVELGAGEHTVELRYWTPGLTAGILLSAAGAAGLAGILVLRRKQKAGHNQPDSK